MPPCAIWVILLDFVAQAHDEEVAMNRALCAQDSLDKLVDRAFKAFHLQNADLDTTVFAKPDNIAVYSGINLRSFLPFRYTHPTNHDFASPWAGYRSQFHAVVTPGLGVHAHNAASDTAEQRGAVSRRSMLEIAAAVATMPTAANANVEDVEAMFQQGVRVMNEQFGGTLQVKTSLVVFEEKDVQSGLPDPSEDFTTAKSSCGEIIRDTTRRPYELCPDSDDAELTDLQRQCCRHVAYTMVPQKFYAIRGLVIVEPVVVVSARITRLPQQTQRAILWHELGHVADFVLFGSRYRLVDHDEDLIKKKKESPAIRERVNSLARQLIKIDCSSSDPEERADNLANLLIAQPEGDRLCYEKRTLVQTLIKGKDSCEGAYVDHYPHDPTEGDIAQLDFSSRPKCKDA